MVKASRERGAASMQHCAPELCKPSVPEGKVSKLIVGEIEKSPKIINCMCKCTLSGLAIVNVPLCGVTGNIAWSLSTRSVYSSENEIYRNGACPIISLLQCIIQLLLFNPASITCKSYKICFLLRPWTFIVRTYIHLGVTVIWVIKCWLFSRRSN